MIPPQKQGKVPFGTFISKSVLVVSKTSMGERSFSAVTPNFWNAFPQELHDCTFFSRFKST